MTRDSIGKNKPPSPSIPAPVSENTTVEAPALALAKPVPSLGGIQTLLDKAADEGLVLIQSPRVRMQENYFNYFLFVEILIATSINDAGWIF